MEANELVRKSAEIGRRKRVCLGQVCLVSGDNTSVPLLLFQHPLVNEYLTYVVSLITNRTARNT